MLWFVVYLCRFAVCWFYGCLFDVWYGLVSLVVRGLCYLWVVVYLRCRLIAWFGCGAVGCWFVALWWLHLVALVVYDLLDLLACVCVWLFMGVLLC